MEVSPTGKNKRTNSSWRFNLGFLVTLSIVLGIIADVMIYNVVVEKEYQLLNPKTYLISVMFTITCFLSFLGTEQVLKKYVIPNSVRNIWIYIGATILGMMAVFFMGTYLLELSFAREGHFVWGSPIFNITAGVCFLGCIAIIVTYYGRDFYRRYVEMEQAQHESQMAALKAQINPHFLFNALNSIAALIRVDPKKAERVTEDLAELFRYSLRSSKTDKSTLQEELDAVKTYLAIEKARFGDRLQVHINAGEKAVDMLVPGLILQPIIENSIKHGASQTMDTFHIDLQILKNGQKLDISVTDNGPGLGERPLEQILQNGTGLSNIRARLKLMYGDQATFTASGQTVRLKIPVNS